MKKKPQELAQSLLTDQSKSRRRKVAETKKPIASHGSSGAFNAYRIDEFCQPSFRSRDQREMAISQPGMLDEDERRLPGRFDTNYDALDDDLHSAG